MSESLFAFVFPGQGSQAVGMLSDYYDNPIVQTTFEEVSDALGYNMLNLIKDGPSEDLNQTHNTQPAILAASTALWRLWVENAEKPNFVAGHSLGEYSALVASGALNFTDAVNLVAKRGEYMQQAVPAGTGKMAAIIGLADDLIQQSCDESANGQVVSPVNYNSPGQVVIAGNAEAVERAMIVCKDKGAKRALPLPVSVPSHCALMKPAAEKLAESLQSIAINTPTINVINNVDVAICESETDIKDALVRQLYCPVRWTETVQLLASKGVNKLIECGPGNVLSGLTKRIDRQVLANTIAKKDVYEQMVSEHS